MSTFDRAAARARAEAATPGSWSAEGSHIEGAQYVVAVATTYSQAPNDAEFIASARTDLPAALDLLDAVLALHPVGLWQDVEPLGIFSHTGCPTCSTDGACPTRLAIEGGER